MSTRISVVFMSFALLSFFLVSCTAGDAASSSVFERAFSACVKVSSEQGEYSADVTLRGNTVESDEGGKDGHPKRDGRVEYTFPENVVGISASRECGEVCVNVCGVNVKPSDNVAARYTFLMDILDVSSEEVLSVTHGEYEGNPTVELLVENSCGRYTVTLDKNKLIPLLLQSEEVKIEFVSFVYI